MLVEAPRWVDLARNTARQHVGRCKACAGIARATCMALHLDVATQLAVDLTFPHRVSFRGHVVARRALKASPGVERWPWKGDVVEVVEVVPERYGEEAYAALGGVLLEDHAGLQRGSVVRVTCKLLDPTSYKLHPHGLIGAGASVEVEVGVRR